MSSDKKKIRQQFRDAVFKRDGNKCKVCGWSLVTGEVELDAHHITDRTLMPNGGYVAANGISLCSACHKSAEVFHDTGIAVKNFSPQDLYNLIGSSYDEAVRCSTELK
jgi:5-methylcytosine-specific restriction endonuclease McrA